MFSRTWLALPLAAMLVWLSLHPARACCPAPSSSGKMPVVNADQNVIILWDVANKTQHFIRRATFKSDANDFGFLVPSPTQPQLAESGDKAFPALYELTKPDVITQPLPRQGIGCPIGCSLNAPPARNAADVRVLDQVDNVAGFQATVLEAKTARGLVDWLKKHGYAYSPEIEAWAKPYIDKGWMITALKVARKKDDKDDQSISAPALRMSFKTDQPLFPYREPDYKNANTALGATERLLRIYFIADARYDGKLTKEQPWTGQPVWAGPLSDESRDTILGHLNLPAADAPKQFWLTEFEDPWPYKVAPADVYFSRADSQDALKRKPIIRYVAAPGPGDVTLFALAVAMFAPVVIRRMRKKN